MGYSAKERRFRRLALRYFREWKDFAFGGLFASEKQADMCMRRRKYNPSTDILSPCVLTTQQAHRDGISNVPIKAKFFYPPEGRKPEIAAFKVK